jgi:hypothetical protein
MLRLPAGFLGLNIPGIFCARNTALSLPRWRAKKITTGQVFNTVSICHAMFAAVIFSNPLLFAGPKERPELIRYQLLQFSQTGQGIVTSSTLQETILKFGRTSLPHLAAYHGFALPGRFRFRGKKTRLAYAYLAGRRLVIALFNCHFIREQFQTALFASARCALLSLSAYLLQTAREKE